MRFAVINLLRSCAEKDALNVTPLSSICSVVRYDLAVSISDAMSRRAKRS